MTALRPYGRRGACPGLSEPMQTGDGLLSRLVPAGTVSLEQMAGLAAAARQYGNGIIEITSRGGIQVRGLRDAAVFTDAVARLDIAAYDGIPIICDPLAGFDPHELIDAHALAAALRSALDTHAVNVLSPKVSVAIDGGGALHLDALTADIRLRAVASDDGPRLQMAVGGDAASATPIGTIALAEMVDTVLRLLCEIAALGPQARGRDLAKRARIDPQPPRPPADPIGLHRLRDDAVALGIGFAFGHSDAATLANLVRVVTHAGAGGFRAAPGRALLVIGVAAERVAALMDAANELGFIVAPDDPRRRVVACAGAPICASAEMPARALAPAIAAGAAARLAPGEVIHVSGCAKGCAHHGPAALTAIGRAGACALFVDGTPAGSVVASALPQRLAELAQTRSARHD